MYTIENARLSKEWLDRFGAQPMHERHRNSPGFAQWVGLYSALIAHYSNVWKKTDELSIVDALPGSNSPKVPESIRLLRSLGKIPKDKVVNLRAVDGDCSVVETLRTILGPHHVHFNYHGYHAVLTNEAGRDSEELPTGHIAIASHPVDDVALYALSQGIVSLYCPGEYTANHAHEVVRLLQKPQEEILSSQNEAAEILREAIYNFLVPGGIGIITHYATVNWTRYQEWESQYFNLLTAFANGAFSQLKSITASDHRMILLDTPVDDFQLFDGDGQKYADHNRFNSSNVIILQRI